MAALNNALIEALSSGMSVKANSNSMPISPRDKQLGRLSED
jgi:hypothetical protein